MAAQFYFILKCSGILEKPQLRPNSQCLNIDIT